MEYYFKQAKEASEEKDVILYFDEAELGLINNVPGGESCFIHNLEFSWKKSVIQRCSFLDISAKITLVGAAGSSANLDNALLSKVRYDKLETHLFTHLLFIVTKHQHISRA